MNITNHIREAYLSGTILYRKYSPVTPSNVYVLFRHGIGEVGVIDGSELPEVEKNAGWPKFAKGIRPGATQETGSVEYPFNIIAVQMLTTNYSSIKSSVYAWLMYKYDAKVIIDAGISMGCYGLYDSMKYDPASRLKGIVAVCGDGDQNNVAIMPSVQGIAWHGDADPRVSITLHKQFVLAYNNFHIPKGGEIKLNVLPGVQHDAWNHAFNADPTKDQSLIFVNNLIDSLGSSDSGEYEQGVEDTKKQIIAYIETM